MGRPINDFYEFDVFSADPLKRVLLRSGSPVQLTPKAFDILIALIERRGQVVDKDELLNVVWDGAAVEENNLARNISSLRKALGETPTAPRYIVTVPGRGYSFVADVESLPHESRGSRNGQRHADPETYPRSLPLIDGDQTARQIVNSKPPAFDSTSTDQSAARAFFNQKGAVIASIVMLLVALGAAFISGKLSNKLEATSVEINRLTYNGNAHWAAISSDGEYVAYMAVEGRKQSLRIMQVATSSNQQLIAPAQVEFLNGIFSPDGHYLYYTMKEAGLSSNLSLYRIPTLGGASQKLVDDVSHLGDFSPDGSRITFTRSLEGEHHLMIASADGAWEKQIAVRSSSDPLRVPAWSPDGRVIACPVGVDHDGASGTKLFEFRVEDGAAREISPKGWKRTGTTAWLADGSGVLMTAEDESASARQIWHVSYPEGRARRVTNDSTIYRTLSLAASADKLVATKVEQDFNLWIGPSDDSGRAKQIADGVAKVSLMPDGRIVYLSGVASSEDIWIMNGDGTGRKQLTQAIGQDSFPVVSHDGRYIFFTSDRTGSYEIWRMDPDGNNQIQLTAGGGNRIPSCSPDGRWLVYEHFEKERVSLRKVFVDGGESMQLTDWAATTPSVSPDSKYVASWQEDRIIILSIDDGRLIKRLERVRPPGPSESIRWTSDGKALIYESFEESASNLWLQPLDRGAPKKLTDFKEGKILSFDLSRDGKQFAIARGDWKHDVILINNFK